MRLKCNDGIVREFLPAEYALSGSSEGTCWECGEEFGVHDTKILKPIFKAHSCKEKEVEQFKIKKARMAELAKELQ